MQRLLHVDRECIHPVEHGAVGVLELALVRLIFRKELYQRQCSLVLYFLISAGYLAAPVLDRSRKITRNYLRAVVVESICLNLVRIGLYRILIAFCHPVVDAAQGKSYDRDIEAVLLDVLGPGVAHEAPPVYILHAVEHCIETVFFHIYPLLIRQFLNSSLKHLIAYVSVIPAM